MGEYVFIDGVQQKLGTCEDLFYMDFVTYVDLLTARRVAHCPGNAQPLGYIEPGAQASRFRFLWPWQNEPPAGDDKMQSAVTRSEADGALHKPCEVLL